MMAQQNEQYTYYCKMYDEAPIDPSMVFIESHNSIDFASNMFAIARELSENELYQDLKIYISCTEHSKKRIQELVGFYHIRCEHFVLRESKEYFNVWLPQNIC